MRLKLAARKYTKGGIPDKINAAIDKAIDSMRLEWEKLLVAVSAALIEEFGGETAEDLGGQPKSITPIEKKWVFDPASVAVRAWIVKNAAKSIKTISATNKDDVKRILIAAFDEDLPIPQIAPKIRQYYKDQSRWKAMRVARTEVVKSSSFGSLEAARQSEIVSEKVWLTSRDADVREEHEPMDGETVKLGGTFSNGSEYPDEPNCRCVMTFKTGR